MNISISSVRVEEQGGNRRGRVATHFVRIAPDTARLLDPERVSDGFYESICKHERAVTEGQGAEQLHGLLRVLCGHAESEKCKPVRYTLNAGRDRQLIRNYLWREGYDWRQTEGVESPLRMVDLRHALTIIAGISRAMSLKHALPKDLRDYDLVARELNAIELCRLYGVAAPNQDAESSALLRLLLAAREELYVPRDPNPSGQSPDGPRPLQALGGILDHLEGLAGVPGDDDGPSGEARQRARPLLAPARPDIGLTPSDIGLLCHEGAWRPVVSPPSGSHPAAAEGFMFALPDGRPLPIGVRISAPLLRLDLLSSDGRWDAAADERLRRLCGWDGEPISFQALQEAFRQMSGDWPPPGDLSPPEPAANSNTWMPMSDGLCEARHYALAGKALQAINGSDAEAARRALAELAEQASASAAGGNPNLQMLIANLRLAASRANLMNDGREVWLRQMALLLDPDAWPGAATIDSERLPVILFGDGPVARHNRIAVASRSSLGIPASHAVRAVLSAPPRSVGPDQVIH